MAQLRWVFRRVITPVVGASLIWIVVLAIAQGPDIALGVDGVGDVADALAGQRIGIVTNHAAVTRDGLVAGGRTGAGAPVPLVYRHVPDSLRAWHDHR